MLFFQAESWSQVVPEVADARNLSNDKFKSDGQRLHRVARYSAFVDKQMCYFFFPFLVPLFFLSPFCLLKKTGVLSFKISHRCLSQPRSQT